MGFLISAIFNCMLVGCIVSLLVLLPFSYLKFYHEFVLISAFVAFVVATVVAGMLSLSVIKDELCSSHRGNRA